MGKTLDKVIAALPAAERRKIAVRAKELIAEESSLQDLRKAMGKTQVQVAKKLGVGQDVVSRAEQRADMLLSTLESYVEGMGGKLSLIAEFPNRAPVRLSGLGALVKDAPKRKRAAARKRA